MSKKDQNLKINEAINEVVAKFGSESITLLGGKNYKPVETFSSGSLIIDDILGIGGYPRGRVIEIYGPESCGKTTLSLHAIAEVQKAGGIAAFIDAEHAVDPTYAEKVGVDIKNLILAQPDSGEQALEIVDTLAKSKSVDLIIVDSVAALTPEIELKGSMSDQTVGAQARLMSKALRKITGTLSKNKTTIIFINQIREKVGVMFGNPETTPGGRALKFFASIRMEVRRVSSIGEKNAVSGNNVRVKVVKNKLASPFKIGETEIIFGEGISRESEIIDIAEKLGIVKKSGSWYKYKDKNVAQVKKNFKLKLMNKPKFFEEIIQNVAVEKEKEDKK